MVHLQVPIGGNLNVTNFNVWRRVLWDDLTNSKWTRHLEYGIRGA